LISLRILDKVKQGLLIATAVYIIKRVVIEPN